MFKSRNMSRRLPKKNSECAENVLSNSGTRPQIERFTLCENDTPQIERYPSVRTICPGEVDQQVYITQKRRYGIVSVAALLFNFRVKNVLE